MTTPTALPVHAARAPFRARLISRTALMSLACSCGMSGCFSSGDATREQLETTSARLDRYEKRYGPLPATRPHHEFRDLRKQLAGKSMQQVTALLGRPVYVFNMGARESWDYKNVAYDSVSGRTVRNLQIWFTKGVAREVEATF